MQEKKYNTTKLINKSLDNLTNNIVFDKNLDDKSMMYSLFAIITLMPYASIKNYCIKKYEYNKEQSLPTSVWLYIGMSESTRANGWYGQVASEAWEDTPMSYVTYPQKIKARIVELIKHPKYALNFYLKKTIH